MFSAQSKSRLNVLPLVLLRVAFTLALALVFTGVVGTHAEAATRLPDLIVSAVSAPSTASSGTTIGISASIKNQGGATSSAFSVSYYGSASASSISGAVLLGVQNVASLPAGTSIALVTSLAIPPSAPSGTFYLVAVADSANVVRESKETNNTRASGAIAVTDLTPPMISGVNATQITANNATITWTTDKTSTSQADYGTTAAYGSATSPDSSLVTSHAVTLSGLTAGKAYHFRVQSKDATGNTALSSDYTFTTATGTATAGTTYYVATTGSDANPGTEAQPFLTIQQGLNLAQPGQTVVVMPGSYQPATFVRSGSTNAAITLLAPSGATLVGNGTGVALTVSGLHDIVIDGFDISNFETGISLDTVSSLVLRDNTLQSNTGVGIQGWKVTDSLFEYNKFLDPGPPYPDLSDAVQDYGLNFYYSARVTVTNNYFFGKHNQALSFKRQNGTAYVADNTFAGCMYTCIYLGQNDDDSYGDMTSLDSMVEHNTIQDTTDPTTGVYYRVSRGIGIRNVYGATVRNNTVSHTITAVETISSPQLWGQAAGNNQEYGNTVN